MRALNTLRRLLSGLMPDPAPHSSLPEGPELEALRARFRARMHHFRLLLAGNNEALEQISALEELARGARPFGVHALRAHTARAMTLTYAAIRRLEELSGTPQDPLVQRFRAIKDEVDAVLAARRTRAQDDRGAPRPLTMPLEHISRSDVDLAGAKMARLGEAGNALGLRVPPGFAITTAAFDRFMATGDLGAEIDRLIQSRGEGLDDRMALAQELQALILGAPLPGELAEAMDRAVAALRAAHGEPMHLVVRSSAVGEDHGDASFAGQYRSLVNVSPESLPGAYREVVASAYSLEAISYRLAKGIPEEHAAMSVGVLLLVDAVSGGVAYSRDPLGMRDGSALIHAVHGLPKQMVDGADASDFFALGRDSGELLEKDIAHKHHRTVRAGEEGVVREPLSEAEGKAPAIDEATARRIFDLAMALERHFGEPQDMEWALDREGELVVLQTRPLPTARPRNPAAHDLDLPLPPGAAGPPRDNEDHPELGRGLCVSPGVASGPVHRLEREADMLTMPRGAVMVIKRPLPRFAPALAEASALVAEEGGMAGHLASVARELGRPALFGMVDALERLAAESVVTVDADARLVVRGGDAARLERARPPVNLMQGSPVHDMLRTVLPRLARLTLMDPDADTFVPRHCQSLHDILRYCHETALLAMFAFGNDNPFPERSARLAVGGRNSQFRIIDLGETFGGDRERIARTGRVPVADVASRPFQAFWRGLTARQWDGPPAVEGKGLASILHEALLNTDLEPSQPSAYAEQNYFMVAPDFLSGQSRFGFHFATVEALVGDRTRENYIHFQFKGGAASQNRREARARLVASLLEELGFETRRTLDWVHARLDNRTAPAMEHRLAALGFLTMHTRQLDMAMGGPDAVHAHRERLLGMLGEFVQ